MNHTRKVDQVLLESSSNTSIVLELEKEGFYQMAVLVQVLIIRSGLFSVPTAGNNRNSALIFDRINEIFTVIALISEHITVLQIKKGGLILSWRIITDLPTCQINCDRIAQGINYGMVDLRGISTSRTTNSLFFSPPFPPEPCWWTRTYEPSIIYSSLSWSLSWSFASSKKIISQMPRLLHREYRLYTLFQDPNRSGKFRQGAPFFRTQMTALIIIRLSVAGRPFPPELSGGTKTLIRSHCSSVISCRLIIFKSMPEQLIRMVSVILTVLYILQTPSKEFTQYFHFLLLKRN